MARLTLNDLFRRQRRADRSEVEAILAQGPSPSTATSLGEFAAGRATRRTKSLVSLLDDDKLDMGDLGSFDTSLINSYINSSGKTPGGDNDGEGATILGVGGPIAESISNFWTGDNDVGLGVGPMATQIPASIFESAKAVGSDIGSGVSELVTDPTNFMQNRSLVGNEDSQVKEKIIDPTIENYKHKYGEGSLGERLDKIFVKDPFGTVLDAATVASGGTMAAVRGGSKLAKMGEELGHVARERGMPRLEYAGDAIQNRGQKLAGLMTQEGRSPIQLGPDVAGAKGIEPTLERFYSNRPVMKGVQKLSDYALEKTPVGKVGLGPLKNQTMFSEGNYWTGNTLRETRDIWQGRKAINDKFGNARAEAAMYQATESKPFMDAAKRLSEKERVAMYLLKNGVNLQRIRGSFTGVDSYRDMLDRSLAGESYGGYNAGDLELAGVARGYIQHMRDMLDDTDVLEHLQNPTDNMAEASRLWDEQVTRTMSMERIDPAVHQRRMFAPQTALRIAPERLNRIAEAEGVRPADLIADHERMMTIAGVADPAGSWARYADNLEGNVIAPNYMPQMIARGEFKNGKLKPPKRGKRAKKATLAEEIIEGSAAKDYLKRNELQSFLSGAMRMDPDVVLEHIAQRERMAGQNGFLHQIAEEFGVKVRNEDGDYVLAKAKDADEMAKVLGDPNARNEYAIMNTDGLIQMFKSETDVMKVLLEVVEDLKGQGKAEVAGNFDALRDSLNKYFDDSAQATVIELLSASKPDGVIVPKTALNTVRDIFESQVKNDTKWRQMMNVWRTFVLAYTPRWWVNTAVGSTALTVMSGAWKPKYAMAASRYSGPERAVELMKRNPELRYGLMGVEHTMEDRMKNRLVDNKVADQIYTKVENLEGFFKRAGFFKFLDDRAKQHMREMGDVIDGYQKGVFTDEFLDNLLENHPRLVQAAMQDTNKFFYNYNVLGTMDRRYVRQFIPFWGWYKFITKLTWSLPAYYPGKLNILQKLGEITDDMYDEEYGLLPPTMIGAIILNKKANGDTSYIPTFGMNPFADFMNPGEGLAGLISPTQLNPVIQAGLGAFGLDTYGGEGMDYSPNGEYGRGLFGSNYNLETGEEVTGNMWGELAPRGFLGQLMRSVPIIRTLEEIQTGGRGVYPDSIPGISPRPLPMEGAGLWDTISGDLVGGGNPKSKDLDEYEKWRKEDVERARASRKSEKKRLRKANG